MGAPHPGEWQAQVNEKIERDRAEVFERAAASGTTPVYTATLDLSPSEYRRARNPGNHIERATFNRYWREG